MKRFMTERDASRVRAQPRRIGTIATAPRSRMAVWHRRVSRPPPPIAVQIRSSSGISASRSGSTARSLHCPAKIRPPGCHQSRHPSPEGTYGIGAGDGRRASSPAIQSIGSRGRTVATADRPPAQSRPSFVQPDQQRAAHFQGCVTPGRPHRRFRNLILPGFDLFERSPPECAAESSAPIHRRLSSKSEKGFPKAWGYSGARFFCDQPGGAELRAMIAAQSADPAVKTTSPAKVVRKPTRRHEAMIRPRPAKAAGNSHQPDGAGVSGPVMVASICR